MGHHGVTFTDGALVAAAVYSNRYLPERFLPDKAIDLIDEAASRLRLQQESKPEEIDNLDRQIVKMKIEIQALCKDNDPGAIERREKLEQELQDVQKEYSELNRIWQQEKRELEEAKEAKERLERLKLELEQAKQQGDFDTAGRLIYQDIPRLEKIIEKRKEGLSSSLKGQEGRRFSSLSESVTERDIAEVVSRATSIPVHSLMIGEREKLLHLEETIRDEVVGQDEAVKSICNAVRISRAGLHQHNRPLGSFLFLGPTGVGKTQLCKALAKALFSDENSIIRIDMSEYMEKFSVSRLIGAPPGYVGYEEGGTLTEAVRRHPYSIVLFDEFEKAHREVSNLLLQMLDEGHLTDSQGRKVDFKNCLIIMTSNIGSDVLSSLPPDEPSNVARDQVMQQVRYHMAPEFINRIDDIILFNRLTRKDMERIVAIQERELQDLLDEQKIHLVMTSAALKHLAEVGYDPVYGARPLKRVIQQELLNPLATMVLDGSIREGDPVSVILNSQGKLEIMGPHVEDEAEVVDESSESDFE